MDIKVEMKAVYKDRETPVKARANIVVGDSFVVRGVKLIENDNGKGLFMSMPSYRGRDGKWRSISHPINSECRERIQAAVLEAYNSVETAL